MPCVNSLSNALDREGILETVNMKSECVIWEGKVSPNGYGRIGLGYAHRIAYEEKYGQIPTGLHIHHKCKNRLCVNANHLETITPADHLLQHDSACMTNGKKTHCPHGHEYNQKNTYYYKNRSRICRACHCIRERERKRNAL